jgi:hypothetical protein
MNLKLPSLDRMIRYGIVLFLFIIACFVAVFAYWSTSERDVLKVNNAPFPVRTIREHPTADGVIILKADYCKLVDVEGRTRISFFSQSREVFLPLSRERGETGCNVVEVPVLIPSDLPAGNYRIKFRVVYQVNPLKEVVEEFESKPFEVVDP